MSGQGRRGCPSSFACRCLKSSATSLNECTPSTSSSISSNEASIHWSISTHTLPWCFYKCELVHAVYRGDYLHTQASLLCLRIPASARNVQAKIMDQGSN